MMLYVLRVEADFVHVGVVVVGLCCCVYGAKSAETGKLCSRAKRPKRVSHLRTSGTILSTKPHFFSWFLSWQESPPTARVAFSRPQPRIYRRSRVAADGAYRLGAVICPDCTRNAHHTL